MKYNLLVLPLALGASLLLSSCSPTALPTGSGATIKFGSNTAPVKITEYLDYQCSHCKVFHDTLIPVIMREYVQSGKATLEVKDFPLFATSGITQNAAHCAAAEGKYTEYTNVLFENQKPQTTEDLKKYADQVGLNKEKFGKCLADNTFVGTVQANQADGMAQGVEGTPSLFVNDKKVEIKAIEDVRQAIDKALEK